MVAGDFDMTLIHNKSFCSVFGKIYIAIIVHKSTIIHRVFNAELIKMPSDIISHIVVYPVTD